MPFHVQYFNTNEKPISNHNANQLELKMAFLFKNKQTNKQNKTNK